MKNLKDAQILVEKTEVGTEEFNEFQAILLNKSKERSKERNHLIELMALKFKMEDYLRSDGKQFLLVGDFLTAYLSAFEIRQNKFAEYIGLRPSNLSKLIKGERSLNHELALIFGQIFNTNPMLWLDVQDKNKLDELTKAKKSEINKYSLKDLISQ